MASLRRDWVGRELAGGRYLVTALLGEGGMGQVYKALDRNIEADVVVKVPHRSMLEQADFAARFTREIRSLVRLSHPQIVKLTDVGDHDDRPFAVMQYLPGGDLEGRRPALDGGRPAPVAPRSLAGWLPGVASALDYIHREGYIHRDVKPANILFDAQGHPFLGDFGVAKVLGSVEASRRGSSVTGAGMVLGTPEYMAPELIMGKAFDGRVDQYALAVTAYEMLCGRKPFEGESATAILVRQTQEEPPAPAELGGPGAEGAARVLLRGLAKVPAGRYPGCVEFAKALVAITSRMTAAATAASTASAEGGPLRCPACSRAIPIPSAVLAAPERARGRKTACPACRAPLRFAETGLALVLEGQVDRPAPPTVIAMAIEEPEPKPSRVARTVLVEGEPGAIPARRAATVRVEAIPDRPAPQGRPSPTELIPQPAGLSRARVAGTVLLDSPMDTPAIGKSPTRRMIPIAAGAVLAVGALAIGLSFALGPGSKQPLARLEPPLNRAPLAPVKRKTAEPIPNPKPSPVAKVEKPVLPKTPDPAPTAPPKREEAPAAKPAPPTFEGFRGGNPDDEAEIPPQAGADDKLVVVSLDEVARNPGAYLGRLIFASELLSIGAEPMAGPGRYQRLVVDKLLPSLNKGMPTASPIGLVAHRDLAENIRGMIRRYSLKSTASYRAIADLRVIKNPESSGSYLGRVERIEFLHDLVPVEVNKQAWGRAFKVVVVTANEMTAGLGRGDGWHDRIEGWMLAHVRKNFKAKVTSNNSFIFDRAMDAAIQQSNAANAILNQQRELERQRSRGGINFPLPR